MAQSHSHTDTYTHTLSPSRSLFLSFSHTHSLPASFPFCYLASAQYRYVVDRTRCCTCSLCWLSWFPRHLSTSQPGLSQTQNLSSKPADATATDDASGYATVVGHSSGSQSVTASSPPPVETSTLQRLQLQLLPQLTSLVAQVTNKVRPRKSGVRFAARRGRVQCCELYFSRGAFCRGWLCGYGGSP